MEQLVETSPYVAFKSNFEILLEQWSVCTNSACLREIPRAHVSSLYLGIHPPTTGRTLNVQELLDNSLEGKVSINGDSPIPTCSNSKCGSPLKSCTKILSSSDYLVLSVWQNRSGNTKLDTKIKEVPNGRVNFNGKIYRFKCMVSHWGDLTDYAHYVAGVKKKKWILVNDSQATEQAKWPVNTYCNEGKKSPYLLFYSCSSFVKPSTYTFYVLSIKLLWTNKTVLDKKRLAGLNVRLLQWETGENS